MIPERDQIQVVMTAAEIIAALESGDYSAEMLMQHLIRHHNRLEQERALADRLAHAIEAHERRYGHTPARQRYALAAWKEARP